MKKNKLTLGIVAHVDAGKTTLSEAMLYNAHVIRELGRVDKGNTALDTDEVEKRRGITISSREARLMVGDTLLQFIDTPGHVDFGTEMERVLPVLDAAVLVISGLSGVESHTRTLWKLLNYYQIPAFIFVNKMDIARESRDEILSGLKKELSGEIIDFSADRKARSLVQSKGISQEFGAREVDRVIRNEIKPMFVDEILFGKLKNGGRLNLSAADGSFIISAEKKGKV